MKEPEMHRLIVCLALVSLSFTQLSCVNETKVPQENLLWPSGIKNNIVSYEKQNIMRTYETGHPDEPMKTCRVYSNVSTPTYYLYQPQPKKNIGLAMVVLPGGGYTDIWLDKEGHNIGLFFAEYGITSLVVKYRTNTPDNNGKPPMPKKDYLPAAVADAKEALRILHHRAEELNIDPDRIGIGGFSAGGHLSLSVCFDKDQNNKDRYPDFAFLIYPWIEDYFEKKVEQTKNLPPMFIVNGQEDTVTPPDICAKFYYTLCKKNIPAELHIYRKGAHGFTFGFGTGNSTEQWPQSFLKWLKDIDMIKDM